MNIQNERSEQRIQQAQTLLEQMSEDPGVILDALTSEERTAVVQQLARLSQQAATIENSADVMRLVDAINHLVEGTPALSAMLLPERPDHKQPGQIVHGSTRAVTMEDHLATGASDRFVQARAPQIRNAVIECHKQLEAALTQPDREGQR